ncbi:Pectate lyase superfamily protein [uncultured Caudovirales phage]|uniref:Pectate lyase superfamily protein n=1 Tax=uncultured Caudovirales phage TaxID=2100421 RepID=A0A6J5NZE6_9CAUD|nr:Pectate lyase superfamily protein [uncultured Caudovirales phage]
MSGVSITGLNPASTLTGSEIVPIVQSGTTVRTTVANMGPVGSFTQSGTGAVTTTVQAKLRETVSVKDFGAVGDGVTDDTAAIQAAITACGGASGKSVYFPAGDYYISAAISVPNYTRIIGDGAAKSRINLQGKPYGGVVFKNLDTTEWGWFEIQDFCVRGGSYAIYNTASTQEQFNFTNVNFEIQTVAGIYSAYNWQINNLVNVIFYYCVVGIYIPAGFANMNNFINVGFLGLSNWSVNISGSGEVNNFQGCRFEAGGLATHDTIVLVNSRNTVFDGCYFENTHERLLNQVSSDGTIFTNCHFTGWGGSLSAYQFSTNNLITFGTNSWYGQTDGPTNMQIIGNNVGKLGLNNKLVTVANKQNQKLTGVSTAVPLAGITIDTVTLSRNVLANTLVDTSALFGKMRIVYFEVTSGGFFGVKVVTLPITVTTIGAGALTTTFGTQAVEINTTGSIVFTPSLSGSTIKIAVSGVSATMTSAFVTWDWDCVAGANPTYYPIITAFA